MTCLYSRPSIKQIEKDTKKRKKKEKTKTCRTLQVLGANSQYIDFLSFILLSSSFMTGSFLNCLCCGHDSVASVFSQVPFDC